jgi:hypothetical protein
VVDAPKFTPDCLLIIGRFGAEHYQKEEIDPSYKNSIKWSIGKLSAIGV